MPLHQCLLAATLCLTAALASGVCWAQYKVVAPDGSVTYTDRPPSGTSARVAPLFRPGATVNAPRAGGTAATAVVEPAYAAALAALPFDLRQVATRFPVQIYTTADCQACESGRQWLQQRGIPFAEKRIVTEDDAVALQRLVGWRTVPTLSIGAQPLRAFNAGEWAGYLDAAGYPRESRLPRGWTAPAPTPLTRPAAAPPEPRPVVPAPPPPPPAPSIEEASERPPGPSIRF